MRRTLIAVTAGLGLSLFGSPDCRAQFVGQNIGADPFSLYYSWYLPSQAYQAMQPRIEDTINANAAMRQYNAYAERAGVFDQSFPGAGGEEDDMFRPFGSKRAGAVRLPGRTHGADMNAIRGLGPQVYYNRVMNYYPRMARGRGANQNVVNLKARRTGGAGFGGGMPNMGPR